MLLNNIRLVSHIFSRFPQLYGIHDLGLLYMILIGISGLEALAKIHSFFFDWKLNNKYQHKIHKMEIDVTVSSNVGNPIMSLPFGDGFNHLLMVISLDSNKYLK
jgi:hypothetical protein